ncbi:MAG TPA: G-D-S-L family lipolytic protein [Salinimicrobium sp.]|nr:G-D-S-L family lipolytic protein [Salinimicrobium sp.]
MKNYIKYIGILALGLVACEPEFENPVTEEGFYTSGEANFSNYVALGNSLTAGYADNALYLTGQINSYPNILAQQFAKVGGGEFTQPLVADNAGGLLLNGQQITSNRLVLAMTPEGPAPMIYTGDEPSTEVSDILTGPFNNMGVPGAKSFHLLAPGYGNIAGVATGMSNPYFVRFASSPNATILEDALAQDPTFFSLWIGNNDVLSYAVSGGTGVNQTGNLDPTTYGSNDITDPQVFASVYSQLVSALAADDTEGVLLNIPDVTSVPFFTTVPNNALVLDAATAAQLTAYFRAVAGIFAQGLIMQGIPPEQAQALASQYAIVFNEGNNRFLIDVPPSPGNPLGFRQMTEEGLLLFTINTGALAQGYGSVMLTPEVMQVLGILQAGGQPTPEQAQLVLNAVSGIDDADALSTAELENINTARTAFNQTIQAVAEANGLAYVDTASFLTELANGGIAFDAGVLTSAYVTGGAFSLEGIHLTPRGYALVANKIIEAINETYGASVPKVNIGTYGTITPYGEVGTYLE